VIIRSAAITTRDYGDLVNAQAARQVLQILAAPDFREKTRRETSTQSSSSMTWGGIGLTTAAAVLGVATFWGLYKYGSK